MDSKLRKILTECIRAIETGARDAEGCLQQYPDRAAELRPHLELWSRLNAAPKAQPSLAGRQRGEHQLMGALADMEKAREQRTTRFLTPVLVKAAAVLAGVALLAGGAAGASAAFGGPDFANDVLSTIGIASSHNGGAPEDALEHADQNAPEAADFGLDTAKDALDGGVDGLDIADQRAADGLNTAGEAQQQSGNDVGIPDGVDLPDNVPDDVPVPDSLPDKANVPDSPPAGPKP